MAVVAFSLRHPLIGWMLMVYGYWKLISGFEGKAVTAAAPKVKPYGRGGLDESEPLRSLILGAPKWDAKRHGEMLRHLGAERILPGHQGSPNILEILRAADYVRTGGSRDWWAQLAEDWRTVTGWFASEPMTPHYSALHLAAIVAVWRSACDRHDAALSYAMADLATSALLIYALAAAPGPCGVPARDRATAAVTVMPLGQRYQGGSGAVQAACLALWLGTDGPENEWPVDMAKITKQSGYWPARVFAHCGLRLDDAGRIAVEGLIRDGDLIGLRGSWLWSHLRAVRLRNGFALWRWERGAAGAMLRVPGDLHNDNGDPAGAATATWDAAGGGAVRVLDIEASRTATSPATWTAGLGADGAWRARGEHENGSGGGSLELDTRPLGRLLWAVRWPVMGDLVVEQPGDKGEPVGVVVG